MDGEASITAQSSAGKLIDMKLSLSEVLGVDWKEKSVFPNVEAALKDEGVKALTDGQEILPNEAQTDLDRFIAEANAIFNQNKSTYHARRITDEQGRQKALIVGQIGKDSFYQTTRYSRFYNDQRGRGVFCISNSVGLVSEGGQVLSVNRALQSGRNVHEENSISFTEIAGQKFDINIQLPFTTTLNGITVVHLTTNTAFPGDYQQMGTFFHEIGHLLRKRAILGNPHLNQASKVANREFDEYKRTGSPVTYQARRIRANEERGAWAMGISFIKDVGRSIGLDCASPKAINIMLENSERSLASYDVVPYVFDERK